MKTLEQITLLAKELRLERDELAARIDRLNDEIALWQTRLMPGIRTKVNCVAGQHSLLYAAIDESRDLFHKPKSITVHGYTIGLRKGRGGLTWEDDDQVVSLIEKRLPEKADLLIKTTKTPIKSALNELDVADLKKIGCQVEDTGDVVHIKPTDGAVDKLVKALLKSATAQAATEAKEAA